MKAHQTALTVLALSLLAVAPVHGAAPPCRAVLQDVDRDGTQEVVLENRWVRLVLETAAGRVASLVYKPTGQDLTWFGLWHGSDPGGGIGEKGPWGTPFRYRAFRLSIVKNTPTDVRAQAVCLGRDAIERNIELCAVVRLSADSPAVELTHTVTNRNPDRTVLYKMGQRNVIRPGTIGDQQCGPHTYYWPRQTGVFELSYPEAKGKAARPEIEDFSRPWVGVVGRSGLGAVCLVDPAQCRKMYAQLDIPNWPQIQWDYARRNIAPGDQWTTRWALLPVQGLTRIDAATGTLVGSITCEPAPPTIKTANTLRIALAGGRPVTGNLTLSTRRLPNGQEQVIHTQAVALTPGHKAIAIQRAWTPSQPGTYVVRATVAAKGLGKPWAMERALTVGQPSGTYKMPVAVKRPDDALPELMTFDGPELPGTIRWCKPSATGGIRALFVHPGIGARELVDLAHRMDLQWQLIAVPQTQVRPKYNYCRPIGPTHQAVLRRALERGGYDVLVMSGPVLRMMPDDLHRLIIDKVRAGMGLVYTSEFIYKQYQSKDTLLQKELFRKGRRVRLGKGRFITRPSRFYGFTANENWNLDRRDCWWEYYFADAVRAIRWAAGHDPDVHVRKVTRTKDRLCVELVNQTDREQRGRVRLHVRDASDHIPLTQTFAFALKPKASAVLTTRPFTPARRGRYTAVAIACNPAERVLDFGYGRFDVTGPYAIGKIEPDKKPYQPNDRATLAVTLASDKQAKPAAGELHFELRDAHGRLLATQRQPVALKPATQTVSIVANVGRPLSLCLDADVSLHVAGHERDAKRVRLWVRGTRKLDDFCMGVTISRTGTPSYLWPCLLDRFARDFGMRQTHIGPASNAANFRSMVWGVCYVKSPNGGSATHSHGDAKGVREFCLHNPAHLEAGFQQMKKKVQRDAFSTPLVYVASDEYGVQSPYDLKKGPRDLCFSTHTLAAFRKHLQKRYASLADLNAAWDTRFKRWDDVRPMKSAEVLKRTHNLAPWLEFRLFMTDAFAAFFGETQKRCRQWLDDPDLTVGMNLLGGPGAYAAVDEYYNSKYVNLVISYPSCWEMAHSAWFGRPGHPGNTLMWMGYNWGLDAWNFDIWYLAAYGGGMPYWFNEMVMVMTEDDEYGGMLGSVFDGGLNDTVLSRTIRRVSRPLVRGLGQALMTSREPQPDVAVYYSISDLYWANLRREANFGWNTYTNTLHKTQALQVRTQLFHQAQLARGRLKHVRALVVPAQVEIVDDKILDEVAALLGRGGVVVLVEPSTFARRDGHGRVRTGASAKRRKALVDRIVRAAGKRTLRDQVLGAVGPRDVVVTNLATGREQPGLLVVKRQRGPITYHLMLRRHFSDREAPGPALVRLRKPFHIYELRTHRYVGHTDTVRVDLPPAGTIALAAVPYAVKAVHLDVTPTEARPGQSVEYSIALDVTGNQPAGDHAVRLEVYDPADRLLLAHTRNILTRAGKLKGTIPLALDAPPGVWRLKVIDTISARTNTAHLTVWPVGR